MTVRKGVRFGDLVPEDAMVRLHGYGVPALARGYHAAVLEEHRLPRPRTDTVATRLRAVRELGVGQGEKRGLGVGQCEKRGLGVGQGEKRGL